MIEDKVSTPHPSYSALELKRDVFRAVAKGTDGVRAKTTTFLPKYPKEQSYDARLNASTIDGLVMGGVEQLCGAVFEGEIDVEKVKASLKPLLENIDNKGNHFNIFAREAFKESFEGVSAILVDMPMEKAQDLAEEKSKGLRPYFNLYRAGDIINWQHRINPVSKKQELTLLVLREISSERKGRFLTEDVTRYRVFEFDGATVTWELFREVKKDVEFISEGAGTVEKVTGIPVAFIGCLEDDPKLLVESRLEIKAYQKESSFDVIEYLSIPLLALIGRSDTEKAPPFGADAYIDIPENGDAKYVQIDAAGHDSLKGTIKGIKDYIKSRVNYLIESTVEKTATEVATASSDKQARLVVWSDELKDALETALMYMGQMIGLGDDKAGEIVLNTKWSIAAQRAEEMRQQQIGQPEPFKKAA